jgi:hypothetical protein
VPPREEGPFSIEKRFDRDWYSRTDDERLNLLALLGASGLPVAIGIIVDGHIVRGAIGNDRAFVTAADEAIDRAARSLYPDWPEKTFETVVGALGRQEESLRERRAEAQATLERYHEGKGGPISVDDVDLPDVPNVSRAASKAATLTFTQATIQAPGQPVVAVATMQVRRTAITAWWFLDEEEGTQVNYGEQER